MVTIVHGRGPSSSRKANFFVVIVLVDEHHCLHEQVILGLLIGGRVDDILVEELVADVHHDLH